jgi:hypothetical protein
MMHYTYATFVASVHICGSLLGTLLADMNLMQFLARGSALKDNVILIAAVHLNWSAMECQ